jgi:hypothetical protein
MRVWDFAGEVSGGGGACVGGDDSTGWDEGQQIMGRVRGATCALSWWRKEVFGDRQFATAIVTTRIGDSR